jgi:hydrogenase 3 maturation protease
MKQVAVIDQLRECLAGKIVVIGIGNPMRGDDALGQKVIARLAELGAPECVLIDAETAPERHFGEIEAAQPDGVLLIDAVDFGGSCGEVAFFEEDNLPDRASSTHDVPLVVLMRYIRLTTQARVGLLGIQPAQTDFGTPLSAPVEEAVEQIVKIIAGRPDLVKKNLATAGPDQAAVLGVSA